jgi:hypothetical protein
VSEIPGITGGSRFEAWDVVVAAHAPALRGAEVHFVATGDGSLIVDEDEPDGSVAPLAEAVERELEPPYRAVAERQDDGMWAVGALAVRVMELPAELAGDAIEISRVGGQREVLVDGQPSEIDVSVLERLGEERSEDFAVRAERLTETTWVVDVSAL